MRGREPTETEMRVARALCAADGLRWEDQASAMTSGNGGDDAQAAYLASARAAIRAQRLPGIAMLDAAVATGAVRSRSAAAVVWQAMIDDASPVDAARGEE